MFGALGGAVAIKGAIFGMGASLSPSLFSVGYIVGRNIGILAFTGGLISWAVAIPIYSYLYGFEGENYFAVSVSSPIGRSLLGKSAGTEFVFNNVKDIIKEIF